MSDSARQFVDLGAVDYDAWVPLTEAAAKLDRSVGQLRRQCKDKLSPRGVACYMTPQNGGQRAWHIHASHDMRLHRGALGAAHTTPDLDQFTQEQRDDALARAACVDAFRKARAGDDANYPGPLKRWIGRLVADLSLQHPSITVSRSSLYRWESVYNCPADLILLIDDRGGNQTCPHRRKNRQRCWAHFRHIYLDENQPSIAEAWRQTRIFAEAQGIAADWVTLSTCRRQKDSEISTESQLYHRNKKKHRDQVMPRIPGATRHYEPGRCWMGDHTQCDFWVWYQNSLIRPWVTAWQDMGTLRIVAASLVVQPNSDTVLATFGDAMRDPVNMGGPNHIHVDNGKDYRAYLFHGRTSREMRRKIINKGEHVDPGQFTGVFGWLGIKASFSLPYGPTGKPTIERWFGTMHGQFDKSFASYCGSTTTTRPERLQHILKHGRDVPLFADVAERLKNFVAGYNANADHQIEDLREHPGNLPGADGRVSPDHAMQNWSTRIVPRDPDAVDRVCRHWYKPVTVGKYGVVVAPLGVRLTYGATDPALSQYKVASNGRKKTRVLVSYDPQDLRRVDVWTEAGRHITTAPCNELGHESEPVRRENLSLAMSQIRQYQKALKLTRENVHLNYLTAAEHLAAACTDSALAATGTDDDAPAPGIAPAALQPRQTPLDGQSNAVRSASVRAAAAPPTDPDEDSGGDLPRPSWAGYLSGADRPAAHDEEDDFGTLRMSDFAGAETDTATDPGADAPVDPDTDDDPPAPRWRDVIGAHDP